MLVVYCTACSSSRQSFDPAKKYSPKQLRQDYTVFRKVLEESHPSLYWFTPKDSMNYYFDQGFEELKDSMTEPRFKTLLSSITSRIHCGHTSVRYSRQYTRYLDTVRNKIFPLAFKIWGDSMAVVMNLNRKDSLLRRGVIITSIGGHPIRNLTDTFFNYISGDGYSVTGRYQSLSNRGSFGSLYRNLYGLPDTLDVNYLDAYGMEKTTHISMYDPSRDTVFQHMIDEVGNKRASRNEPRPLFLNGARNTQVDTGLKSAYVTVNTFSKGNGLRRFFRETFRALKENDIRSLVVDVRANGGGDAGLSTLLTRYLVDHPFRVADSLYATHRSSRYARYIEWQAAYKLMMAIVTRKHSDGYYHFGYFERHYFKPKKRYHFDGDIYIITGGNSFSATTIFAKSLKGQHNIKIVGEETGGGAYGNTAWMIPDVVLPNTRVRFRLPKFRLVMDQQLVKDGRGIMPDIEVAPTINDIRKGMDPKLEVVRRMIEERNRLAQNTPVTK